MKGVRRVRSRLRRIMCFAVVAGGSGRIVDRQPIRGTIGREIIGIKHNVVGNGRRGITVVEDKSVENTVGAIAFIRARIRAGVVIKPRCIGRI